MDTTFRKYLQQRNPVISKFSEPFSNKTFYIQIKENQHTIMRDK